MINEKWFEQFPALTTERLILRKVTLTDSADLQELRSHPAVMEYMDSEPHHTVEMSQAFIAKNDAGYEQKTGIFWAITDSNSGRFMGDFSFWRIDAKNARAEIGYTLHPDFWGQGVMREAMVALFRFGFEDLNLHSFEANINPKNDKSRRLLKKLGFQKEAYFRESYYYNGVFLDSEIYCLLEADFRVAIK